jgi:hypothetical protein
MAAAEAGVPLMDIAERLRAEGAADIPPKGRANQWLRLACPFCGADRAALNYDAGWFKCYHCKRDVSAEPIPDPDAWAIYRFQPQIKRAVSKVKKAYGKWIERDLALNFARWFVYNYDAGKESKNDGGRLADWEADYDGAPWRLDGKVQSVLDRDLMNWAESEKTWKEKTHAAGDMLNDDDSEPAPIPKDGGLGYRLRARRARIAMNTGGMCFAKPNLDGPFDLGALKRCELQRNGLGPVAGHCKWCNRALGDSVEERWDRGTDEMLGKAA